MFHRRFLALAATAVAAVAGTAATAAPVELTDTTGTSGFNGGTLASMPLTADGSFVPQNTPWQYDAGQVAALDSIESISISLVIGSANTSAPGDTNFDELSLGLDGFDTGLKLNGEWQVITSPGQPDVRPPLVFTGAIQNAASILSALKADNQLVGTILDSDPGDDFITLGSTQGAFADATLVINGIADDGTPPPGGNPIPLPPAVWAGLVTLAGMGAGMTFKGARKIG